MIFITQDGKLFSDHSFKELFIFAYKMLGLRSWTNQYDDGFLYFELKSYKKIQKAIELGAQDLYGKLTHEECSKNRSIESMKKLLHTDHFHKAIEQIETKKGTIRSRVKFKLLYQISKKNKN